MNRALLRDDTRLIESRALTRASVGVFAALMLVASPPLARWCAQSSSWTPMAIHALALGVVLLVLSRGAVPRTLIAWLPLALVPLLYVELRWIIPGVGRPQGDALIASLDLRLFHTEPSRTLALAWRSILLSELLHLCYLAYYAIVYVPPALLWQKKREWAFASTVFAIVTTYTLCFIAFIVLPVDGPRFLHGPAAAPTGPIRTIVLDILSGGSSRGTAFPSAHVAASVVASICALRYQRALGLTMLVVTLGMMVGAVYGGYHYAVDVIAGLAMGLVASAISYAAERAIAARSTVHR
jgi:membrane-associated phospholipid phosphatase